MYIHALKTRDSALRLISRLATPNSWNKLTFFILTFMGIEIISLWQVNPGAVLHLIGDQFNSCFFFQFPHCTVNSRFNKQTLKDKINVVSNEAQHMVDIY